jgi:hypothetical protein
MFGGADVCGADQNKNIGRILMDLSVSWLDDRSKTYYFNFYHGLNFFKQRPITYRQRISFLGIWFGAWYICGACSISKPLDDGTISAT